MRVQNKFSFYFKEKSGEGLNNNPEADIAAKLQKLFEELDSVESRTDFLEKLLEEEPEFLAYIRPAVANPRMLALSIITYVNNNNRPELLEFFDGDEIEDDANPLLDINIDL